MPSRCSSARAALRLALRSTIKPGDQRLAAEEDVVGDVEFGNEVQFLVDDGDARGLGVAHAGEADWLAVDADRAFILGVDARQDFHQRRLAGAVFAHQRMDLARRRSKLTSRKAADAAEMLGNAARRQHGVRTGSRDRLPARLKVSSSCA